MGKQRLSQLFLIMAGLNAFIGAAAASMDVKYFVAGLGTGALFYYLRHVLNSEGNSLLTNILHKVARAFD